MKKIGRHAQPTNTSVQQLEHKDSKNQVSKPKLAEVSNGVLTYLIRGC